MSAPRVRTTCIEVFTVMLLCNGCRERQYSPFELRTAADDCYSDGRYADADRLYRRVLELNPNDTDPTLSYCFFLAACPDPRFRDGERARALMESLHPTAMSGWRGCSIMAAVYAEIGNFAQAQEWQQRALSVCHANVKRETQQRLELYRSGHALRVQPPSD
jgi:tetratricopeptide (TPR) repeat protein